MTTARVNRWVENEKLFRTVNERLEERVEALAPPNKPIPFFCECVDETCMERLNLTLQDYRRVRANDDYFVVSPGHPLLDGEDVVEENRDFLIVSKEAVG